MTNNTNTTMTQAQALRHLIDNAPTNTPAEVIEAAEKLYTSKTKKYDRPKGVKSKERIINESLVPQVVELVKSHPDSLVNATFINDNLDSVEVRSPQKARVIAEIAIEQGLLEKYSEKGRTYYRVAAQSTTYPSKPTVRKGGGLFYFLSHDKIIMYSGRGETLETPQVLRESVVCLFLKKFLKILKKLLTVPLNLCYNVPVGYDKEKGSTMSPDSPYIIDYIDELTEKFYPEYDYPEWDDDWDEEED